MSQRCTVVIPTVAHVRPERVPMLDRAIGSVLEQDEPCDVSVERDHDHDPDEWKPGGAAKARNRGIERVSTEWTAFLDDDDYLYPQHVSHCLELADQVGADLVYPWWDGANESLFRVPQTDPETGATRYVSPEGLEFDDELHDFLLGDCDWQNGFDNANFLPITVVVRTSLLQEVGGMPVPGTPDWPHLNSEDHGLWIRLLRAGARFAHLPERTWRYVLHGKHLSGPT